MISNKKCKSLFFHQYHYQTTIKGNYRERPIHYIKQFSGKKDDHWVKCKNGSFSLSTLMGIERDDVLVIIDTNLNKSHKSETMV